MTRQIGTLCALALIFQSFQTDTAVAQTDVQRSEVFPAGMNGVSLYRIPGVVVTPTNRILAYCEARKNGSADWGEIEIHLRTSDDGGKTWSEPRRIAHQGSRIEGNPRKASGGEKEQTVNNPVAIVDRESGQIHFLYCINYARCFYMKSVDDGDTWSAPVEITATFEPFRRHYPWKVIATGPGHGVKLKSGRLVVPIWLAYGGTGDHKPSASATIYSDDQGKTWKAGEIAVPDEGEYGDPNETMIAALDDGRVMLVTRSVSKPNRKLITYSENGASGWSKPVFHDQLPEPVCMASVVAYPKHSGYVIFSNPDTVARDKGGMEQPGGRGRRQMLTVRLSRDYGKSWPVKRLLEAGPSAYSDLAILKDGSIICLFEGDKTITLARFPLEWLVSGNQDE
ncbi:MAG: Sialidase precursor [Planctomycetota bacterium]